MVAAGYDRLAARYPEWSRVGGGERAPRPDRSGHGRRRDRPCSRHRLRHGRAGDGATTERGLDVVGVDLSPVSLARAEAAIPGGAFLAADIADLSLPLRHFGLVTAFNSVIHIPRRRHAALFRDVRRWLRPGGVFVLNVETDGKSGEGTAEAWLDGVEMYWSGWTAPRRSACSSAPACTSSRRRSTSPAEPASRGWSAVARRERGQPLARRHPSGPRHAVERVLDLR